MPNAEFEKVVARIRRDSEVTSFRSAKLSSVNQMPLSVSDRLGLCDILAPIGAGGMGAVYRALNVNGTPSRSHVCRLTIDLGTP
jgi:hypothetical protein